MKALSSGRAGNGHNCIVRLAVNWQEHAVLTGVAQKFSAPATLPWWRRSWVGGTVALFALTLLLYAPVGRFEFVNYDDPEYVTENTHLNQGFSWSGIVWAFTKSHSANWHPLTWLSHMLDCQLWGVQPGPHHWHNVVLHALNAVLLFGWLRQATGATGRSWVVAALFAWHPLHVESVAWISERKDVLSAFWGLATLWCYTCYQQAPPDAAGKRPRKFYGLALVGLALGLMSKPMLVTWPFVLLLLDFWPGQRWGREPLRRLVLEKLPFLALSVISCVITFAVQSAAGATHTLHAISADYRLGNAVQSYALYFWQTLCPRELLPFYPFEPLVVWRVALAGAVLAGISFLVWRNRQEHRWGFVGWSWYLGTLVPVIGLVQVGNQALANRYSYLPLIGVFIGLAWLVQNTMPRLSLQAKAPFRIVVGLLLAICFGLAGRQVWRWENTCTLFVPVTERFPDEYVGHAIVGTAYTQQTNYSRAFYHLRRAIELQPNQPDPYKDIGDIFMVSNRLDEAVTCYRNAVERKANYFPGYFQLGLALTRQGKYAESLQAFTEAEKLRPDYAPTLFHLGNVMIRMGQAAQAIPFYERSLRLRPGQTEVYNNLAYAYSQTGQTELAIEAFRKALALAPDASEMRVNLGAALLRQNQIAPAIEQFELARQRQPDFAPVHLNLGLAQARAGNWSAAAAAYQDYVRFCPDQVDGRLKLADALRHLDQPRLALEQLEAAHRLAPDHVGALINLAALLGSTAESGRKDSPRALQLATRACELTQQQDPAALLALAAAQQQNNQLAAARQTAEAALAAAQARQRPELGARAEHFLQSLPPASVNP